MSKKSSENPRVGLFSNEMFDLFRQLEQYNSLAVDPNLSISHKDAAAQTAKRINAEIRKSAGFLRPLAHLVYSVQYLFHAD